MTGYALDVPPVTALAHKLRGAGLDVAKDILTVEEFAEDKTIQGLLAASPLRNCEERSDEAIQQKQMPARDLGLLRGARNDGDGVNQCNSDDGDDALQNNANSSGVPVIQIKALSHTYNAGSVLEMKALSDINLTINQGEMVALIGHTGSGKSTLIQHLNGLLKPSTGQILIEGEDIQAGKSNLKAIRQKVGLVFQYPEHQLFETTIYKDVAFGPTRMGLEENVIDEYVRQALTTVGLSEDVYEKSPFELSGGQKRRAAIAGVLAMRPKILILDEPAAGLDPKGREEILAQIKHMHEALGITVILVSHSMDDAARLTERIIVLNQGKLLYDDTPSKVFAHAERLTEIGLDIPQMSHLAMRLGRINSAVPQDIFTIEDLARVIMGIGGQK